MIKKKENNKNVIRRLFRIENWRYQSKTEVDRIHSFPNWKSWNTFDGRISRFYYNDKDLKRNEKVYVDKLDAEHISDVKLKNCTKDNPAVQRAIKEIKEIKNFDEKKARLEVLDYRRKIKRIQKFLLGQKEVVDEEDLPYKSTRYKINVLTDILQCNREYVDIDEAEKIISEASEKMEEETQNTIKAAESMDINPLEFFENPCIQTIDRDKAADNIRHIMIHLESISDDNYNQDNFKKWLSDNSDKFSDYTVMSNYVKWIDLDKKDVFRAFKFTVSDLLSDYYTSKIIIVQDTDNNTFLYNINDIDNLITKIKEYKQNSSTPKIIEQEINALEELKNKLNQKGETK